MHVRCSVGQQVIFFKFELFLSFPAITRRKIELSNDEISKAITK